MTSADARRRLAPPRGATGWRATVAVLLSGFAMGMADLVPGVSGGTVALVVGIYERLVANIRRGAGLVSAVLRLDAAEAGRRWRGIEWGFLLPLLAGVLSAVVALAGVLSAQLATRPVLMSALFLGLIVGAVVVSHAELRRSTAGLLALAAAVAVVTFVLLGLRPGRFTDPSLPALFGGGAVAVCAMILPGVSGSFLLLLLGLYEVVLGAVDAREVVPVGVFAVGAAVGLGLFSTVLNWLLQRWHDRVLAVLIGIMAGSLRVLWPWPAGGEDGIGDTALAAPPPGELPPAVAAALVGLVVVVVVGRVGQRVNRGPAR